MKFGLFVALMILGQTAFAETLHEKKTKEEMLSRVDSMVEKVQETREALKVDDAVTACAKIEELFVLYPEHLKAVGTKMDLFNSKNVKAKNESLAHLIYIHQQALICKQGKECEHLDIDRVGKQMKAIGKSLSAQRKTIKKGDVDFNNNFRYEYEF